MTGPEGLYRASPAFIGPTPVRALRRLRRESSDGLGDAVRSVAAVTKLENDSDTLSQSDESAGCDGFEG